MLTAFRSWTCLFNTRCSSLCFAGMPPGLPISGALTLAKRTRVPVCPLNCHLGVTSSVSPSMTLQTVAMSLTPYRILRSFGAVIRTVTRLVTVTRIVPLLAVRRTVLRITREAMSRPSLHKGEPLDIMHNPFEGVHPADGSALAGWRGSVVRPTPSQYLVSEYSLKWSLVKQWCPQKDGELAILPRSRLAFFNSRHWTCRAPIRRHTGGRTVYRGHQRQ